MSLPLPTGLEIHEFTFRNQKLQILTCETFRGTVLDESTDLTGFMIWPSAHLMCTFLCSRSELLKNKTIIELGSGCALAGILASRFAREVVLSDMSVQVLDLVEKNLEERDRERIQCRELLWGNARHHEVLLGGFSNGFDVVLGADVIYPGAGSIERLGALLDTAVVLLRVNSRSVFICAYLSRHWDTDIALADAAVKRGLRWEVISPGEFIEPGDYFPSILIDACIILFSLRISDDEYPQDVRQCMNSNGFRGTRCRPEWSTTSCGRGPASRSVSPEVWSAPDGDIFGDDYVE